MKKYEYRIIDDSQIKGSMVRTMTALMNELGKEGWRVINLTVTYDHGNYRQQTVLMEREVTHMKVMKTSPSVEKFKRNLGCHSCGSELEVEEDDIVYTCFDSQRDGFNESASFRCPVCNSYENFDLVLLSTPQKKRVMKRFREGAGLTDPK